MNKSYFWFCFPGSYFFLFLHKTSGRQRFLYTLSRTTLENVILCRSPFWFSLFLLVNWQLDCRADDTNSEKILIKKETWMFMLCWVWSLFISEYQGWVKKRNLVSAFIVMDKNARWYLEHTEENSACFNMYGYFCKNVFIFFAFKTDEICLFYCLFCFDATLQCSGFLLALHTGITFGGSLWPYGWQGSDLDGLKQGKHSARCTSLWPSDMQFQLQFCFL